MRQPQGLPPLPPLPPGETDENEFSADSTEKRNQGPTRWVGEVAVFCTLATLGSVLLALVAVTDINPAYPATFYGLLVYVAWRRYFVRP